MYLKRTFAHYSKMSEKIELVLLGKKIRELRMLNGHTQDGFANQIGLARSFYGSVERGEKNISALNLIKISRALNVKVGELFSLTEQG